MFKTVITTGVLVGLMLLQACSGKADTKYCVSLDIHKAAPTGVYESDGQDHFYTCFDNLEDFKKKAKENAEEARLRAIESDVESLKGWLQTFTQIYTRNAEGTTTKTLVVPETITMRLNQ